MNIVRYTICLITFVLFSLSSLFNGISDAANLEEYEKALNVIEKFAKKMCDEISQEGKSENIELSGEAKAELKLNWLVKKLVDIGIEGAADYQKKEYEGVLRKDLADILKDSRDCKREIFRELKSIFFEQHDVPTGQNSMIVEEETTFSIHYEIGSYFFHGLEVVSGQADVYLKGEYIDTLKADQRNPFVAVKATVPSPGEYSYKMSLREKVLDTESGQTDVRRLYGNGTINIEAGKAYSIYHVMSPYEEPRVKVVLGLAQGFGDIDLSEYTAP